MRATRWLHRVHRWAGLITGINILLLSVTGAYLVFKHEIQDAFGEPQGAPVLSVDMAGPTPYQTAFDRVGELHPEAQPVSLFRDKGATTTWELYFEDDAHNHYQYTLDEKTGAVYRARDDRVSRVNQFILDLHANLLLDTRGTMILGFIGLAFMLSTITGLLIYGPFMKAALFGALRMDRGIRRISADFHKLLGAGSLAFNLVISVTGVGLTLGILAAQVWLFDATVERATARAQPEIPREAWPAIDVMIRRAEEVRPEIPVSSAIYPGLLQGPGYFLCFHADPGSLSQYIPVITLISCSAPENTETLPIPWWVAAVLICVPFHFGDFAGIGMKVVYCIFGLSAGGLAVSGAILSISRWRKQRRLRRRRGKSPAVPATVGGEAAGPASETVQAVVRKPMEQEL